MPGTLYLVATPIGNLQDITFRAVETLRSVEIIACEDTRHTRKLLSHYGISNKLISYHEHNEVERAAELGRILEDGKSIAVVSDAGTPGISDPSFRIVQIAHGIGARIVPVPGPAAFVNAVIVSGIPTDSIFFGGFLPSRASERRRRLEVAGRIPATLVFYEAPHRLARSLADCAEVLGNRDAAVVRELTKVHEEVLRSDLRGLARDISLKPLRGEIVIVVDRDKAGAAPAIAPAAEALTLRVRELEKEFDHKTALKKAAREFGLSRSEVYRHLMTQKN